MKNIITFALLILLALPAACFSDPAELALPVEGSAGQPRLNMAGLILVMPDDLTGYKVYCEDIVTGVVTMKDLGFIEAGADDRFIWSAYLPEGDYDCALTAYNSRGYESDYGNVARKHSDGGIEPKDVSEAPPNAQ